MFLYAFFFFVFAVWLFFVCNKLLPITDKKRTNEQPIHNNQSTRLELKGIRASYWTKKGRNLLIRSNGRNHPIHPLSGSSISHPINNSPHMLDVRNCRLDWVPDSKHAVFIGRVITNNHLLKGCRNKLDYFLIWLENASMIWPPNSTTFLILGIMDLYLCLLKWTKLKCMPLSLATLFYLFGVHWPEPGLYFNYSCILFILFSFPCSSY